MGYKKWVRIDQNQSVSALAKRMIIITICYALYNLKKMFIS